MESQLGVTGKSTENKGEIVMQIYAFLDLGGSLGTLRGKHPFTGRFPLQM